MTTAKPPARYSAMESARSGDFATPELHHPSGHDLSSVTIYLDRNYQTPDGPRSYLGINDWQDSFSDGGASFHQSITSMSGGTYNISFVDVTDKAGNERFYYPGELQALGFRTSFEVTGGSPDTTKPQLTSLALPTTIDVSSGSGALDASVGASDVGAGVSSVTVYLDRNYQTPDGPRSYLGINDWQDSFSDGGASFHQSITSMSGGTYNISFVDVTDKAGNERFYYPGELQALGFRTSFEITDEATGNMAPVFGGDLGLTVTEGASVAVTTSDLTATDSDNTNLQLVYSITGTSHGTVLKNAVAATTFTQADLAANLISFRHDGGELDGSFSISLTDGIAAAQTATVIATVNPHVNDAPTTINGGPLAIAENSASGTPVGTVVGQDPDDAAFTFTLTDNAGGRFAIDNAGQITVANGMLLDFEQSSTHNVTVRATDPGGLFFEKAFAIAVADIPLELVNGGAGADKVSAGNGNDQAFGNPGNDTINGGDGNDYLNGGADDDYLFGDAGNDALLGDTGNDYLNAGLGADLIMGGVGNDTVLGSDGDDYVNGQDGDDLVFGGEGADTVVGDSGNDYINGENGNDIVLGGSGNDTVLGGDGSDYINGGADDDQVFGGNSADVLIGDDGNDYLNGDAGNDNLTGGSGNDTLLGADGNDYLSGGTGHDNLTGGLGDDTLFAGAGSDYLKGDAGDDFFIFEANFGTSLIIDFETGTPAHHDFILFKGGVFVDSADALSNAVQQATNVVITANTGDNLTLANVQLANLVADDFRFA